MTSDIVLELNPSATNARNSEGAFVTLRDGTILFVYTRYGGGSQDHDRAVLAACTSGDGGRTWQVLPEPVVANEGGMNVMSVSFLRLPSDELGLFYLRKNSPTDCRIYLRRSRDEGRRWSEPELCIPMPGYHCMNNDRVVQLRSSRLLAPAALHRTEADSGFRPGRLHVFMSDDAGATWRASETVTPPFKDTAGFQEPGLVELRDGRIWMHCRTETGRHWQSFSIDGGEHWTAPTPTDFKAPCSPLSVKRLPGTGDLLAIWNDHSGRFPIPEIGPDVWNSKSWGRTPLVSAISRDDGATWEHHRELENDFEHGYCYTALHFAENAVLLGYCAGGPEHGGAHVLCRLRVRRVALDWFYNEEEENTP